MCPNATNMAPSSQYSFGIMMYLNISNPFHIFLFHSLAARKDSRSFWSVSYYMVSENNTPMYILNPPLSCERSVNKKVSNGSSNLDKSKMRVPTLFSAS